jgi:exodeoxyribonuclease-3
VAGLQLSAVQALPSSQKLGGSAVCVHPVAGEQLSAVQALLSSQLTVEWTHPVAGLQLSVVQALLSSQKLGGSVVCTHPLAGLQLSAVQALPSSQKLGGSGVFTHPVAALQLSAVQALPSLQLSGVPGTHCAVAASHVSTPLQALPSSHGPHVRVMAAVPLAAEVSVLPQMPLALASWAMLAGVPSLPRSTTCTSNEKVQPAPLAKLYGGASENFTSNGSVALATGSVGQLPIATLPMNWMGGGAPGVAPGSGVHTPPATLTHEGKKSIRLKTWLSGAPASRLGKLVSVRLMRTVLPMTRFRLSPLGNPMISWELQTVWAWTGALNAAPVAHTLHERKRNQRIRRCFPRDCLMSTPFGKGTDALRMDYDNVHENARSIDASNLLSRLQAGISHGSREQFSRPAVVHRSSPRGTATEPESGSGVGRDPNSTDGVWVFQTLVYAKSGGAVCDEMVTESPTRVRVGDIATSRKALEKRSLEPGPANGMVPDAWRAASADYSCRVKIATWNVNGIRARVHEVAEWAAREKPDVICLQELKATADQIPSLLCDLPDYWCCWHGYKGYSGVALHVRKTLAPQRPEFAHPVFDHESRIVTARIAELTVASIYVPNGNKDFAAKVSFLEALDAFAASFAAQGAPLVLCGDLNVTAAEIDVHPRERRPNAVGQRPEERALLRRILDRGLLDLGRALDPGNDRLFTWWAPWRSLRERNIGWRLDYVLASAPLAARATSCPSYRETGTSDHAPVVASFRDA